MEFSSVSQDPRRVVIHRATVTPNSVAGLQLQTPQERKNDIQEVIVLWRGRQIQHQQQGGK